MLNPFSLKGLLLSELIANKKITRTMVRSIAQAEHKMESNAERRMREICEEYPVYPYNIENKLCDNSAFIAYWRLVGKIKPTTVFKKV